MVDQNKVLQRATPLVHLPAILAETGTPLASVLDGTGISPDDLRPDAFIPYAGAVRALDQAALLTGRQDIGLRLGLRQGLSSLGPVGTVMRHSATLGEALSDFVRFQIGNSTGAAAYLHQTQRDVAFGYYVYRIDGQASPQLHDLIIAAADQFIGELTHRQVRVEEFHTIRPLPVSNHPYLALGDAPIRFGQSQTCLFLSASAMSFPLPEADAVRKKTALSDIQRMVNLAPLGLEGRIRHTVGPMLASGKCNLPDISEKAGFHPRTLQRLLRLEGTSFDAVRDDVRYVVARDLLALTPLSVLEIALSLGFSTQSSFIHAFQRWTGTSPAKWRRLAEERAGPG
jgi:AraC-like DNA-binding protein